LGRGGGVGERKFTIMGHYGRDDQKVIAYTAANRLRKTSYC
jgi:hypothetical protein